MEDPEGCKKTGGTPVTQIKNTGFRVKPGMTSREKDF
jgi:hypothetical protein